MRRNNVLSRLSACFFSKNYKLNYIHAVIHIFRTKDGYFHLRGRSELALEVQRRILPRFGFDATKAGGGRGGQHHLGVRDQMKAMKTSLLCCVRVFELGNAL